MVGYIAKINKEIDIAAKYSGLKEGQFEGQGK
jgi:hypothetical protein